MPGALGRGDSRYPYLGNGGYDVAGYDIDLTFDPEPNLLSARVAIEATATQTLESYSLDFVGYEVHTLEVNGNAASYDRQDGELIVQAPEVSDRAGAPHRCCQRAIRRTYYRSRLVDVGVGFRRSHGLVSRHRRHRRPSDRR